MSRELLCTDCAREFMSRIPVESLIAKTEGYILTRLPSDPGFRCRLRYGKAKATTDEQRTIRINGEPMPPNPHLVCDLCNASIFTGDPCACRTIYLQGTGEGIASWEGDYIEVNT